MCVTCPGAFTAPIPEAFVQRISPQKTSPRDTFTGLTTAEVEQRIAQGHVNRFEVRAGRTYNKILRDNIFNVFNILLFTLLFIVLLLQDYATIVFAGFSVVTSAVMGTVQEINAKRKLDRLARLTDHSAVVWRDGERFTIDEQEIVQGDYVVIAPGDRLAVDGELIASDSLEIDESQITGESDAIHKTPGDDMRSGSFCVAGSGVMIAQRVGADSTMNQVSSLARIYQNTLTPTQRHIATIVQFALVILAILGPVVFISGHLRDEPFLQTIRNTIVFTTSLVAQGLIVSIMLSFTVGAIKMTRKKTLIQRINAVESMANTSVLCFDKTGTLTENRLHVERLIPLPGYNGDTTESLLHTYVESLAHRNSTAEAIAHHLNGVPRLLPDAEKLREIPFNAARKWGAVEFPHETLLLGAPERLFTADEGLQAQVNQLAGDGLRVLAFGRAAALGPDNAMPHAVEPVALIAVRDRVRDDIRSTLDEFKALDVEIKVISGDHPDTVQAVATEAGLHVPQVVTGDHLETLKDAEFAETVQQANAFARVEPLTKRRIIEALRGRGEYVAMVGDGVNDVPALKAADMAIAMNAGAQITKDVADIVLLNNALSTLPLAFREGTEITQTLFGTTRMFLTKNFFNTLQFILILLMTLPFPVSPIQISWVAFGTVNVPAGLMSLGILRPEKMKNFRDDVLDYIITVGFTGAVAISALFLVTISYLEGDLDRTRGMVVIFYILFGLMIAWDVHGIDIMRPSTLRTRWRGFVATSVLTGGALLAATILPDVFEFYWPPPVIILLTVLVFIITMMITRIGLRNRGLLHHVYALTRR